MSFIPFSTGFQLFFGDITAYDDCMPSSTTMSFAPFSFVAPSMDEIIVGGSGGGGDDGRFSTVGGKGGGGGKADVPGKSDVGEATATGESAEEGVGMFTTGGGGKEALSEDVDEVVSVEGGVTVAPALTAGWEPIGFGLSDSMIRSFSVPGPPPSRQLVDFGISV